MPMAIDLGHYIDALQKKDNVIRIAIVDPADYANYKAHPENRNDMDRFIELPDGQVIVASSRSSDEMRGFLYMRELSAWAWIELRKFNTPQPENSYAINLNNRYVHFQTGTLDGSQGWTAVQSSRYDDLMTVLKEFIQKGPDMFDGKYDRLAVSAEAKQTR